MRAHQLTEFLLNHESLEVVFEDDALVKRQVSVALAQGLTGRVVVIKALDHASSTGSFEKRALAQSSHAQHGMGTIPAISATLGELVGEVGAAWYEWQPSLEYARQETGIKKTLTQRLARCLIWTVRLARELGTSMEALEHIALTEEQQGQSERGLRERQLEPSRRSGRMAAAGDDS